MKLFFFILNILFCNLLFSQDTFEVKYKMQTLYDGLKNYTATLTFSNDYSCFEYQLMEKDTSTIEQNDINGNLEIIIPDKKAKKIFVNLKNKTISELSYLKNSYMVQDTLLFPVWNITDKIKKIGDYSCRMATTSFKGRKYEAWFTTDLPIRFGPWKLNGLPGLIILAQDNKNEVYFEVTSIGPTKTNIIKSNEIYTFITKKNYEKVDQNEKKNIEERLKAMGDRDLIIDIKFDKKNDIELFD